jgi:hypothetical protein
MRSLLDHWIRRLVKLTGDCCLMKASFGRIANSLSLSLYGPFPTLSFITNVHFTPPFLLPSCWPWSPFTKKKWPTCAPGTKKGKKELDLPPRVEGKMLSSLNYVSNYVLSVSAVFDLDLCVWAWPWHDWTGLFIWFFKVLQLIRRWPLPLTLTLTLTLQNDASHMYLSLY